MGGKSNGPLTRAGVDGCVPTSGSPGHPILLAPAGTYYCPSHACHHKTHTSHRLHNRLASRQSLAALPIRPRLCPSVIEHFHDVFHCLGWRDRGVP
jgi:hypothetical protein